MLKDKEKMTHKEPSNKDLDTYPEDKNCARLGEKPVSNFDKTTGKTDPNIQVIPCCEGLKEIDVIQDTIVDSGGRRICVQIVGGRNSICAPCGNGKCDSKYEDGCSCPEDCN